MKIGHDGLNSGREGATSSIWIWLTLASTTVLGGAMMWPRVSLVPRDAETGIRQFGLALERHIEVDGSSVPFGKIGAVVTDREGRMYVADSQAQEIIVLDSAGRPFRKIGRRGAGPGEFMSLQPTLGWREEVLLAIDARQQRVTMFDKDGGVVATRSWQIQPGLTFPDRLIFSGGSSAYLLEIVRGPMRMLRVDRAPDPSEVFEPVARYSVFDAEGGTRILDALEDTVSEILGRDPPVVTCIRSDGSRAYFLRVPFSDRGPLRAFSSDGHLVRAHREMYRLDIHDPLSGQVVQIVERDFDPIPIRDEDWEALPEIRQLRLAEEGAREPLEAVGYPGEPCPIYGMRPDVYPVIRTVIADEKGRFWTEVTAPDGFVLDGFDANGRFIGSAAMPPRDPSVTPYIRGDRLYIVTIDEYDVQGIDVYNLIIDG